MKNMNMESQSHPNPPQFADVLIVGSGICGSTYLRIIADALPDASIVMVEAGPGLTEMPGLNIKNIVDDRHREQAQVSSQGPTQFVYDESLSSEDKERKATIRKLVELARPGTFLLEGGDGVDLPAGAASSNVGGMGSHWTCACPTPRDGELIPFIEPVEMDRLLAKARMLLEVHTELFEHSEANGDVLERLKQAIPATQRPVAAMPMACRVSSKDGKRVWTGPNTILGGWTVELAKSDGRLRLLPHTLAVQVLWKSGLVTGALLRDVATGEEFTVDAKVVVIAADSFRSPQLLWNSKIRPDALGCYFNEHPQVLAAVSYVPKRSDEKAADEPDIGVFWVPFDETEHPFHGQVLPLSVSPIPIADSILKDDRGLTLALSWFCRKDLRREDRVTFSETERDFLGMPAMHIHYGYSAADRQTISAATSVVRMIASSLGKLLPGEEPRLLAAGRSLHYQGTLRMGAQNDGDSVCDPFGCVWDFTNLFVAGNGVIPTSTACNPTLTSTALSVRGAERVVSLLNRPEPKNAFNDGGTA